MSGTSSVRHFAAVAAAVLGIGALAAMPAQTEDAECRSFSNISEWMTTMETAGRGAVADLQGTEAASFVSATSRIAEAYSADKVSIFMAFQPTPTPHGLLGPGGALAVLYENGCGTDVLLIAPDVMAEIVKAARRTAV